MAVSRIGFFFFEVKRDFEDRSEQKLEGSDGTCEGTEDTDIQTQTLAYYSGATVRDVFVTRMYSG